MVFTIAISFSIGLQASSFHEPAFAFGASCLPRKAHEAPIVCISRSFRCKETRGETITLNPRTPFDACLMT